MRWFTVALATASPLLASWPLERLFSRHFVWGTAPSENGYTLAVLWDAKGSAFLDLYASDPDSAKLTRLVDEPGGGKLFVAAAEDGEGVRDC